MSNTKMLLELRTNHIELSDALLLNEIQKTRGDMPNIYPDENGAFIIVSDEINEDGELSSIGYSDSFIKVLKYAQEHSYSYIRLDRDVEEVRALPTFDW